MCDKPFVDQGFNHVLAVDNNDKFKAPAENNLKTTFVKKILTRYICTFFLEFIANDILVETFRAYIPSASTVVLKDLGLEERRRVYIAVGFSLDTLDAKS